ncbi:MAG TPA: PilZ domain-containing protein [Spirochaetota bacterium]|nr:PilZ domain-containing protein [Spirochaetota bacterium]
MFFKLKNSKSGSTEKTEKRKGPRAGFYQASYFLPANAEGESSTNECWFSNISEGGIAFETKENNLKEGDEIKILYKIGAKLRNDALKVLTSRTRYNKFLYGCAFIDSDENRNVMINEYVKTEANVSD